MTTTVLDRMLAMRCKFVLRTGKAPARFALPSFEVSNLAFELWGTHPDLFTYHRIVSDLHTNQCWFYGMRLEIRPFWGISA